MAKFKDLMKAFLYEDVDDEEVVEEEAAVVSEPEIKPAEKPAAPVKETVHPAEAQKAPASAEDVLKSASAANMKPAEPVVTEVQTSIFDGLDMEDIARPEAQAPKKKTAYRYDRRKSSQPGRRTQAGSGEEYQAVISPIFGNVDDEHKEFEAVHNAIELPKPEEGFEMTTIISPMYGNEIPAAKPVTSIPQYKAKKKKAAPEKEKEAKKVQKEAQEPAAVNTSADFLVKESVPAPKEKKAEEPKQESLGDKK